jgi:hypothetical protein
MTSAPSLTALPVTCIRGMTVLMRGLPAPVRAVLPVRAPGDRMAAPGASPRLLTGQLLLDLDPQTTDSGLSPAQLVYHPWLDLQVGLRARAHRPQDRVQVAVDGTDGQDDVLESLLRGTPSHITTIAVSELQL